MGTGVVVIGVVYVFVHVRACSSVVATMCEPEERDEIVSSIVSLSESIMQKADELRRYDSEESDCAQGKWTS